jgi:hypothetical protein
MTDDLSPTEFFRLLADETRVDILRSIAVAQCELEGAGSGPAELSFSTIYDHVDVETITIPGRERTSRGSINHRGTDPNLSPAVEQVGDSYCRL